MGAGRTGIGGAMLIGACCLASAAVAATPAAYPEYPTDRSRESIVAWLRQTDLEPTSVIGVSDDALYAVEATPGPGVPAPQRRVAVRQEALSADFARTIGGRSLVMVVDIDCATKRVFQRELRLYKANNKLGSMQPLGGGRDWETPPSKSAMEGAVTAVCSGALPLASSLAAAAKTPSAPTPAQTFMRAATPAASRPGPAAPPPPEIPPLPADTPIATGAAGSAAAPAPAALRGAFE
jgi:hypothetical protein